MRIRCLLAAFLCAILLLQASQPAFAQVPPPAPVPPTLWSFLGIPQGYYKMRGVLTNRRGNRPGREPTPPLKNIADPANLESLSEPIKVAAEIKQAEDLAPQKIKGIKYLAEIGCGCYNKDGKITAAMVAALNDCTDKVRAATVKVICEAAAGEKCKSCGQRSCCKKDVLLRLAEMAYARDEQGCYMEPSSEIREAAARALQVCCSNPIPVQVLEETPDRKPEGEGEEDDKVERKGETITTSDPAPYPPHQTGTYFERSEGRVRVSLDDLHDTSPGDSSSGDHSMAKIQRRSQALYVDIESSVEGSPTVKLGAFIDTGIESDVFSRQVSAGSDESARTTTRPARTTPVSNMSDQAIKAPPVPQYTPDLSKLHGEVKQVDSANGFVTIHMPKATKVPVGSTLTVYHKFFLRESVVAQIEVVGTSKGTISARSLDRGPLRQVSRGDRVRVTK